MPPSLVQCPRASKSQLDAAVAAHKQAMVDCETNRKVAEAAAKRLGERATRANVAREKLTAAQMELTAARERLTLRRSTVTDDELAMKADKRVRKTLFARYVPMPARANGETRRFY